MAEHVEMSGKAWQWSPGGAFTPGFLQVHPPAELEPDVGSSYPLSAFNFSECRRFRGRSRLAQVSKVLREPLKAREET